MSFKTANVNLLVRTALLIISLVFFSLYIFVAVSRINYPFELEWMEGGMLQHSLRILAGQSLYVKPALEFVPFTYNPLYFYIGAVFIKIFGTSFFPLRLLSFLSSSGCFYLIYLLIKKQTASKYYGFISAGFFAAAFCLGGGWLDLARNDSLFLFLTLLGFYQFLNGRFIVSAILLGAAFYTKQSVLLIIAPLIILLFFSDRRNIFRFNLILAVLVGGGVTLLNILSHGWYCYYVFELPALHPIINARLVDFWVNDLFWALPIASSIIIVGVFSWRNKWRQTELMYLAFILGLIGSAWLVRIYYGSYNNTLIPAYAGLAMLLGMILNAYEREDKLAGSVIQLFVIGQMAILFYNPISQLPAKHDIIAGTYIVNVIKEATGEVFIPFHGYLSEKAGKKSYAHQLAMLDVLRGARHEAAKDLLIEIKESIKQKKYSFIILDVADNKWGWDIDKYYPYQERIFADPNSFWPVTGWKIRPAIKFTLSSIKRAR